MPKCSKTIAKNRGLSLCEMINRSWWQFHLLLCPLQAVQEPAWSLRMDRPFDSLSLWCFCVESLFQLPIPAERGGVRWIGVTHWFRFERLSFLVPQVVSRPLHPPSIVRGTLSVQCCWQYRVQSNDHKLVVHQSPVDSMIISHIIPKAFWSSFRYNLLMGITKNNQSTLL